jgi:acyl carrier protein
MQAFEEIRRIVAKHLNVPAESVTLDSTPSDLPGWDSLRHVIIVMELEHAFGIRFELEEIPMLKSIGQIVLAVQQRKTP